MNPDRPRTWYHKFRDAFRGCKFGLRWQSSFAVHFFAAALVLLTARVLQVERWEWCVLLICITVVLTAEMVNSALEFLARAITSEVHPEIGRALDTGSAAVLVAAIGASVIGLAVFVPHLWRLAAN